MAASDEVRIHRPARDVVHIERLDDGAYEVVGRAAGRAVRFSNLTDEGALAEVVRRLERLGVDRLLRKAGIGDGDTVVVGDVEFSWWKDQASEGIDPSQLPRRTKNKRAAE